MKCSKLKTKLLRLITVYINLARRFEAFLVKLAFLFSTPLKWRRKTNKTLLVCIACFVVMFFIRVSLKLVPHRCELGGNCHAQSACDCVTSAPRGIEWTATCFSTGYSETLFLLLILKPQEENWTFIFYIIAIYTVLKCIFGPGTNWCLSWISVIPLSVYKLSFAISV